MLLKQSLYNTNKSFKTEQYVLLTEHTRNQENATEKPQKTAGESKGLVL